MLAQTVSADFSSASSSSAPIFETLPEGLLACIPIFFQALFDSQCATVETSLHASSASPPADRSFIKAYE